MEGIGMVDQPCIVPAGNDGVHILKAMPAVKNGKIVIIVGKAPQIVASHHVDTERLQSL